ncbi:hypothetical protein PoB_002346900 [Plakobranchus ocellatus]|uniref:Uncharacterized protein n=1 Tax=Plakobranchus ocellatus TaxID=259542 RepID=A0AAV3ZRC7_9GAST|nr:hypothetical protein PoB_002346900 [Plakobranchus ocellatus]
MPITQNQLLPHAVGHQVLRQKEQKQTEDQKENFDRRLAIKTLRQLDCEKEVCIKTIKKNRQVGSKHNNLRSYIVRLKSVTPIRGNRKDFVATPKEDDTLKPPHENAKSTNRAARKRSQMWTLGLEALGCESRLL